MKLLNLPQRDGVKKKRKKKPQKTKKHPPTHNPHVFAINISPDTIHVGARTLVLSMCEFFLGEFRLQVSSRREENTCTLKGGEEVYADLCIQTFHWSLTFRCHEI